MTQKYANKNDSVKPQHLDQMISVFVFSHQVFNDSKALFGTLTTLYQETTTDFR